MITVAVRAAQWAYVGSMNVLPTRGLGSMSTKAAIAARRNFTR